MVIFNVADQRIEGEAQEEAQPFFSGIQQLQELGAEAGALLDSGPIRFAYVKGGGETRAFKAGENNGTWKGFADKEALSIESVQEHFANSES